MILKLTLTQDERRDVFTEAAPATDTLNEPVDHNQSARVAIVSDIH